MSILKCVVLLSSHYEAEDDAEGIYGEVDAIHRRNGADSRMVIGWRDERLQCERFFKPELHGHHLIEADSSNLNLLKGKVRHLLDYVECSVQHIYRCY